MVYQLGVLMLHHKDGWYEGKDLGVRCAFAIAEMDNGIQERE